MSGLFDEHFKRAQDFLRRKMWIEALSEFQQALEFSPRSIQALASVAFIYGQLGKHINQYRALNRIVELYEDDTPLHIRQQLLELEKKYLFWDTLDRDIAYFQRPDILEKGIINPFSIGAYIPLTNKQRYQALRSFVKTQPAFQPKSCAFSFSDRKPHPPKIKLGFLCADCRPHPTGYVIAEFFESIDRNKFEVFLYDAHPDLESYPSKRIYKTIENIVPVDKMSDEEAARKIYEDKIDVLIDMNGFTTFSRLPIMTYQPAPAQGTFLGYIGTLGGVPGIDYHFVDKYSILEGEEKYYYETLKYLDPVRWVIDHKIELPQNAPLKRHLGFKKDSIVLCCFNNLYKFTPNYFDLWARILKRVPKAVLWFYGRTPILEENIKKEFEKRGIDSEQIVCSQYVSHTEHLARYKVADLLLDTEIYNAHTTGMEALFMGLPLITCPGTTYASRVGGALLNALEMDELICKDIQEYEDKVVHLCENPEELKALHQKLAEQIQKGKLFDTQKFTRSFEKACEEMYEESLEN